MSMSRTDYQVIANALREADASPSTVAIVARRLADHASNFNAVTFIAAATISGSEAE